MLRSMYSGISGMKVNQTKLDVIGNNIANVGTTAFKVQRVRFQDMLSQNAGRASGPSRNLGGVNPRQVGLGVQLAGIDTVITQGNMQPTSRNLDVAIDGEGYFMVAKGEGAFRSEDGMVLENNEIKDAKEKDVMFTRDGSFTLDTEGNLLNSDGLRVLGYSVSADDGDKEGSINLNDKTVPISATIKYVDADSKTLKAVGDLRTLAIPEKVVTDPNDPTKTMRIISFTIEKDGLIKATCEGGKKTILGQIAMASFKNPAGLEKIGQNLLRNSPNSGNAIVRTGIGAAKDGGGADNAVLDNSKGYGDMLQGMLEMSNVDLGEQFTDMIVATRAFQASGKMISTGDEILQDIINLKR